jgi:ABC-2 type transport system ATP-binding protein
MNEPWIRIDDVRLSRGGRLVLEGITSELSGRAIGLVGANGAGKSTLIGALLGVLKADSGSIRVLDLQLPRMAMEVRARAGVMAEQAGVFPGGSGVDAVVFAGMLSGLSRHEALRKAHRALDALDVGEERYRPVRGFSTGMRQRCKLAMSLVHDPEILILDEPTVGLDPPGRTQLLTLIRDLRDEGRRVLVSTHIMEDADFLCDDILLLEAGSVAYSGSISALVDAGVGIVVASGEGLDAAFAEVLGQQGYSIRKQDGERIAFEPNDDSELRRFWQLAAERGAEVRSLGRELRSLEDAVVHAMKKARREYDER